MYLAIVQVSNGRVAKFAEFDSPDEAQAHVVEWGGFVYDGPYRPDLWVDVETVSIVPIEPTREQILKKIEAIEGDMKMIRGLREFLLLQLPQFASEGGVTEQQLYAANPFYKKLKDANIQISALRSQL